MYFWWWDVDTHSSSNSNSLVSLFCSVLVNKNRTLCGAVDQQFKRYVNASGGAVRKRVEELGVLIGIYMVNTTSYQTLCTNEKDGHRHFIILLYRNRHTNECTLRPFGLVSQEPILEAGLVKQYAQSVIARDEVANPSYFNSSPVVPFRR